MGRVKAMVNTDTV